MKDWALFRRRVHVRPKTQSDPAPTRAHSASEQKAPESLLAPSTWRESATASECTLHQLAPYIGKLKSTIARDLIARFSARGDLVVDPFAGSGTVPLEAVIMGRRALASDMSAYAATLTSAKLSAPASVEDAIKEAESVQGRALQLPSPDLRRVPSWVRAYFHPETLKETLSFARICRQENRHFLLGCVLGILHHQRPGFLSFPSSHLVPYLRNKNFPRSSFPELYGYRALLPRLTAKIARALRRPGPTVREFRFVQSTVEKLTIDSHFDAVITSPPYMNALDYGRDNRLRSWFIDEGCSSIADANGSRAAFIQQMTALAILSQKGLRKSGYCVLVVGESVARNRTVHPARSAIEIFAQHAPSLLLSSVIIDTIPDVRRARRDCRGVKEERIIVFRRVLGQ